MNSLLGQLGNGALNISSLARPQERMPSMLMQAFGAALRGESPQQFMQNLANQHPQLKQLDLNNLQSTAQSLCNQKGINSDAVLNQIDSAAKTIFK